MKTYKALAAALLGTGLAVGAAGVQAASTTVMASFTGNDCAGFFGDNFEACTIFINDAGERIELSPVIAKYEYNDVDDVLFVDDINGLEYPSVDGSEFQFPTYDAGNDANTGSWTYTQGTGDPFVRYWATKAGNDNDGTGGFKLFWVVDDFFINNGTCYGEPSTGSENYTLGCLSAAQTVQAGDWTTPGDRG